jgi:ATP-binding cassette subfamily C (CFTR/MRP) protein 1
LDIPDNIVEKPETATTLLRVLTAALLEPFLAAIPSRLFVIIFQYAQPLLIRQAIRFVTSTPSERSWIDMRMGIVLVSIVVYVGLAVFDIPLTPFLV